MNTFTKIVIAIGAAVGFSLIVDSIFKDEIEVIEKTEVTPESLLNPKIKTQRDNALEKIRELNRELKELRRKQTAENDLSSEISKLKDEIAELKKVKE